MKKILVSLFLLSILSSSLSPDEFSKSQDSSHPLLSAVRILSFYPFCGENDELCFHYEDSLKLIISSMMDTKDYKSLEIMSCIIHEILDIHDYGFLKQTVDIIDDFIIEYYLTKESISDIFFQEPNEELLKTAESEFLCFS